MNDSLSYRIPGEEVKFLTGKFIKLASIDGFKGFVCSNFLGTEFYGFIENEVSSNDSLKISPQIPIVISKEEYLEKASVFRAKLEERNIDKAIFSRVKQTKIEGETQTLFSKLVDIYPNAFCYYFQSEILGEWVGASPEKLVDFAENSGSTIALASTKKAEDNSEWGIKELKEQQLVADFIADLLTEKSIEHQKSERYEVKAGPVKHLATHFSFSCSKSEAFHFLKNLHPTPAVSGFPREIALGLIQESELHDREIYAGMIGLISENAMKLFVNLRCFKRINNNAFLFLGGGFTSDSIPLDEWHETENKAATILSLM